MHCGGPPRGVNKARREADTMSASGNQARDGLFACLTHRAIRPQIGMRSQYPCLDFYSESTICFSVVRHDENKKEVPADGVGTSLRE